ncbi:MAG: WYL domain-containing protein [Planctomycetes bacterium]|nr:WYL domain-containing protein [Planctomycetota bacterium]
MKSARVFRLLKIITLLRTGRSFDSAGLATELGVSRRTLFRDLQLLESTGIPYRFDRNDGAYKIHESFFLEPVALSLEESLALLLVTRLFIARQVHPAYQHAVDAALKIESTLPAPILEHCGAWLSGLSMHWPPSSPADAHPGLFESLQRAAAEHRRVRMRYDSVNEGTETEFMADPLRLLFMTRGWYLIARSHLHGEVRTFKVDRIVDLTITEDTFTPDKSFSERAYFGKAWRMIPEAGCIRFVCDFPRRSRPALKKCNGMPPSRLADRMTAHCCLKRKSTDSGRLLRGFSVMASMPRCWVRPN